MNTHDKYELLPLPDWFAGYSSADKHVVQAYARAAIEADRKRRGEPVGEAVIDICEHGHKFAKLTDHPVNNQGHPSCVHCLRIGLAKARAAQPAASVEPVAWLYEDELPDNYPYDTMFPYSKVDGVRMFPVYAPQPAEPVGYIMPTALKQLKAGGHAVVGGVSQGFDVPIYTAPQPAESCASLMSDKTACGSENGDCDSQPAEPVKFPSKPEGENYG